MHICSNFAPIKLVQLKLRSNLSTQQRVLHTRQHVNLCSEGWLSMRVTVSVFTHKAKTVYKKPNYHPGTYMKTGVQMLILVP